MRWRVNGVETDQVSVADRGFAYGDGLFETIAVRGGECRFLSAHLQRLMLGCERLHIPMPAIGLLEKQIDEAMGGSASGTLKLVLTRGTGARGYMPPAKASPTCAIGFAEEAVVHSSLDGIRARYCQTTISRNPVLAGMKTLNRLEQVMARAEWTDAGMAEGLMLNDRNEVVCGTMSNLFVVANDGLWTPALDEAGVIGVMRGQILELAKELRVPVKIQSLEKDVLTQADDIFLTNARIGMWPVAELAGKKYQRSTITKQLWAGLRSRGVEECKA